MFPRIIAGLVAVKPTSGRVPRTGQFPLPLGARSPLAHVSLIARKVQDLALALPIIAGPDFRDHAIVGMPLGDPTKVVLRDLKVAYFDDDGVATPDKRYRRRRPRFREGIHGCGGQGRGKPATQSANRASSISISVAAMAVLARAFLKSIGTNEISPLFERALAITPAMPNTTEALSAFARWDLFRNSMLRFIENYYVLLSPVIPSAPRHGDRPFSIRLSTFVLRARVQW